MHQEKYNLNWHTYSDHLREMLYEMKKRSELTDVTLICDDKTQFKVHKVVLSTCSTVFKSIINDLPWNSISRNGINPRIYVLRCGNFSSGKNSFIHSLNLQFGIKKNQ